MTFQYIKPTEEQLMHIQAFRDKYEALMEEIKGLEATIGTGRGFSIAKTKLEESSMWLNKAITKND